MGVILSNRANVSEKIKCGFQPRVSVVAVFICYRLLHRIKTLKKKKNMRKRNMRKLGLLVKSCNTRGHLEYGQRTFFFQVPKYTERPNRS